MSDSFADLWSASAPAKPKPQTLSTALSSSSSTPKTSNASSKPDVFALLAGSGSTSGSGSSTPRYGTGLGGATIGGSRPITPSISTLSSVSSRRQTTPQPQPQSVAKTGSSGSSDAFGDLFSSSSATAASGKMTLAARLAMEAQRKGSAQSGQRSGSTTADVGSGGGASAWAGLDALSGGLTATPVAGGNGGRESKAPAVVVDDVDDWGLSDFGSSVTTVRATSGSTGSTNGAGMVRPNAKTGSSLWDLDDFASSTTSASASASGTKTGAVQSQSLSTAGHHGGRAAHKEIVTSPDEEFDFGGREDRVDEARWEHKGKGAGTHKLLDLFDDDHDVANGPESSRGLLGHEHDEDDFLGVSSKPVEATRTYHTPSPEPARQRPPPISAPKPPSPPPHILGQIVEMGFSIQQARAALAQTQTGLDVPAAIESLLSNASSAPSLPNAVSNERDRTPAETPPTRARGVPKGQKERERERLERQRAAAAGGDGATSTPSVADLQEQADKLIAQASEIGLSVFSKASAMWGKGKEKVVKAYEERSGTSSPFGDAVSSRGVGRGREAAARPVDGRPKWMQEAVGDEFGEEKQQGGFRDDDDGDVVFEAAHEDGSFQVEHTRPAPVVEPTHHEEEVDLFSDAPVAPRPQTQASAIANLSSTRPGPPQGRPKPGRQQSTATSSSRSTPVPPPTMPPPPERTLPTASAAALATAQKHKTTGTEQFKLGQYAAAADAYSAGIQVLPSGHLLLVPLYTNRALARIRCGEYKAAEGDCARALGVVLDDSAMGAEDEFGLEPSAVTKEGKSLVWSPAALPPSLIPNAIQTAQTAWAHPQGRGVDLADGYVKALRRRAEALEGREKWAAAASDWEMLAGCAWASEGVRKDAMRGRGRCKGMMGDSTASANGSATTTTSNRPRPTPAVAKPKPRPAPTPSISAVPSQALRALQSQNAQAEADDALKDSLKDTVDARLAGWRQGREGNIRALLVGLDIVLWDTALEGVRVRGLHELLSPAQVKKGYVRVIARVHPDKLNSSNSTVEQRMLANGVFGTLNEAWIAFQATQK